MRRSVPVVVLALVLLAAVPVSPAAGTAPATTAPAVPVAALVDEVCAAASTLLDAARPRDARRLVESARRADPAAAAPCLLRLEQRAASAVEDAEALAAEARGLAATDPAAAREKARAALALDEDNALAAEVVSGLDPPTAVQTVRTTWQRFLTGVLEPLGELAIPVAGVLAVVLLAARAVVVGWAHWPRSSARRRRSAATGGVVLGLAAGVWLAHGLPPSGGVLPGPPWSVVVLGATLLGAVALLAFALGTRLRLAVEVHGADGKVDEAATGHVVALLAEIAGEQPRGLEVPRGADVSALDGTAISGVPANAVVALLVTGVRAFFGVIPWRLRVDLESPHLLAVALSRNGRSVAAGVVDRDALGLRTPRTSPEPAAGTPAGGGSTSEGSSDDGLPDLHPFAAALAVVEMARAHRGFEGLGGVTDWRSLGLTEVANRSYQASSAEKDTRVRILTHALRLDPHNVAAAVSLHHARYRRATDVTDLQEYVVALETLRRRLGPAGPSSSALDPMRARVLHASLVARANLGAAVDASEATPPPAVPAVRQPAVEETWETVETLVRLLQSMGGRRSPHRAFAAAMRSSAGSLALAVPGTVPAVEGLTVETAEARSTSGHDPGPHVVLRWLPLPERLGTTVEAWVDGGRLWRAVHTEPVPAADGRVGRRLDVGAVDRAVYVAVCTSGSEGRAPARSGALLLPGRTPPRAEHVPVEALAHEWTADTTHLHPAALYNYACRPGLPRDVVLAALRASFEAPGLRAWAAHDPSLHRLRDDDTFQSLVTPPSPAFLDIGPVKEHVAELRRAGLVTPQAVVAAPPAVLVRYLGVDPLVVEHLREVAALWLAVPDHEVLARVLGARLTTLHGHVVVALLTAGVGSPSALRAEPGRAVRAAAAAAAVQQTCGPNVRVSDSVRR